MHHRLRFTLVFAALAAVAALFALAGCGGKSSSSTAPPPPSGGPSFNFSFGSVGTSHSITFPNAGSFGYHCAPHASSGMTGTVTVATGGADSATVDVGPGGTLTFSPSTVTIKPGGSVRWQRPASSTLGNHTATSN